MCDVDGRRSESESDGLREAEGVAEAADSKSITG